jgi:hypothetical protein
MSFKSQLGTIGRALTSAGHVLEVGAGIGCVSCFLGLLEEVKSPRTSERRLHELASLQDPLISMTASRRLGVSSPTRAQQEPQTGGLS